MLICLGFRARFSRRRATSVRDGQVLVLGSAEQVHQRAQEARGIAERQVALETELEDVLAQKDDLLGASADAGSSRARAQGVLAQQPIAERVEGVDGRVRLAVGHQDVDARLHLLRRVVREGQRQDLARHERDEWR